jgi:hypothetical protein
MGAGRLIATFLFEIFRRKRARVCATLLEALGLEKTLPLSPL